MAGVVRDILEMQAPGVFFGEQARVLSYAPLIKSGTLLKLGRGRGIIGGMTGKKWAERKVNVHEDYRLQYIDGDKLRGEINCDSAVVEPLAKDHEHADGKEFVFKIATKDGQELFLACETEDERQDWINTLNDVSSGKFKLNRHLQLITKLLEIEDVKIKVEIDRPEFLQVMAADGYQSDRFVEILEQYIINLHSHLARAIAEDMSEFRKLFLSKFSKHVLRIVKSQSDDTSKGYYHTHFVDGELQIHYVKAWTNVNALGEDLPYAISEGEPIPYVVYRSIRRYMPVYESYMKGFDNLFRVSGFSYDYCVEENYHAMVKGGYGPERFAEIFFQEHLKALIEKWTQQVAKDYQGFIPAFTAKLTNKRIVIRPAENPDAQSAYYESNFKNGDLVITYKAVWTNISSICDDLPSKL